MAVEPSVGASGWQLELRHGAQRAVVVEVGGGLRVYEVDGWQVLDGYEVGRMADGGRGQPLLPWPNRLADGAYEFGGDHQQLPIDEVSRHNAIHGLTRWQNWTLEERSDASAQVGLVLHPRPGYPFSLKLQIGYTLDTNGLTVRTTAHNLGDGPLPFGAGQHPYFSVGTSSVNEAQLQLAADSRLELDGERRLPTGRLLPIAGSDMDFHKTRVVGPLVIDECFTDLGRDAHGHASATLSAVDGGCTLSVWMEARYRYLQAFTGDTLAPERRRQGLALEPMTCPPNAFRTGADLIVLQPDESITLEWGVTPAL